MLNVSFELLSRSGRGRIFQGGNGLWPMGGSEQSRFQFRSSVASVPSECHPLHLSLVPPLSLCSASVLPLGRGLCVCVSFHATMQIRLAWQFCHLDAEFPREGMVDPPGGTAPSDSAPAPLKSPPLPSPTPFLPLDFLPLVFI